MTAVDVITGSVVLAAAAYLLYRSIRSDVRGCRGCDGGCHARPSSAPPVVELRRRGPSPPG